VAALLPAALVLTWLARLGWAGHPKLHMHGTHICMWPYCWEPAQAAVHVCALRDAHTHTRTHTRASIHGAETQEEASGIHAGAGNCKEHRHGHVKMLTSSAPWKPPSLHPPEGSHTHAPLIPSIRTHTTPAGTTAACAPLAAIAADPML